MIYASEHLGIYLFLKNEERFLPLLVSILNAEQAGNAGVFYSKPKSGVEYPGSLMAFVSLSSTCFPSDMWTRTWIWIAVSANIEWGHKDLTRSGKIASSKGSKDLDPIEFRSTPVSSSSLKALQWPWSLHYFKLKIGQSHTEFRKSVAIKQPHSYSCCRA